MNRYVSTVALIAATAAVIVWKSHSGTFHSQSHSASITSSPTTTPLSPGSTLVATLDTPREPNVPSDTLDQVQGFLKAARAGDRDAQYHIAKIMRGCANYTRKDGTRMSVEDAIVPYQKSGALTDVTNVFREFERCSRMWNAKDLGTAGEWLALATKAKQPQAMALSAEDLLWKTAYDAIARNAPPGVTPETPTIDPALDTTQDPRKLLREAVESNNPDVYYAISHNALLLFPGSPEALTLYYSWMLVACQRGLDCSKNSELAGFNCSRHKDACDEFKDPGDYALWLASNDRVDLNQVETRAADIAANLDAGQYDALGLE